MNVSAKLKMEWNLEFSTKKKNGILIYISDEKNQRNRAGRRSKKQSKALANQSSL